MKCFMKRIRDAKTYQEQRDWALQDRDRAIAERESIQALCDELRKERDRVVVQLAEALESSNLKQRETNLKWKQIFEMNI